MKLFIWLDVPNVTHNYHNDGGVAVVAETLEAAQAAIPFCSDSSEVVDRSQRKLGEPDACFDVGDVPATVFVFPNAGCC